MSNNTTTTTTSSSTSSFFPKYQQQTSYHHHHQHEEEKKEQMSKDSQSTAPTHTERSLSPIPPPSHNGSSSQIMMNPAGSAPNSPPSQHSFSSRPSGIPPPSSSRSPPRQQHHHSTPSNNSTMNSSHAGSSLNTSGGDGSSSQLSAADALAVRRESAEHTIAKLRNALDDSSQKDTQSKTALAKSDAVILELRSSVRQLKRQLDRVQDEKNAALKAKQAALEKMQSQQQESQQQSESGINTNRSFQQDDSSAKHAQDLQMQLDRAHAQILTADMVRKELEDTLEAEQYTWELRVQDQERQIAELQQDCATLVNDLEAVRNQWKSGQEQQDQILQELQSKLQVAQDELARYKQRDGGANKKDTTGQQQDDSTMADQVADLQQKLQALEQERAELQACLDEALKELEAVDAELQQGDAANGQVNAQLRAENENLQRMLREQHAATAILEPLTQLHRLVLERDGVAPDRIEAAIQSISVTKGGGKNSKQPTRDAQQVIAAIQLHLDQVSREKQNSPHHHSDELDKDLAATRNQVRELQAQISVYKGDLMAREESSAELRTSLKEAVSLLKPLQDAVAKADREKSRLQQRIEDMQKRAVPSEAEQLERKKLRDELVQKDKEIDTLKQQVDHLEVQLTKAKTMAARGLIAATRSPGGATDESPIPLEGESKARAKLRAKRAEEQQLKQLLRDAQSRFKSLHQQNAEVESKNMELQGRLKTAGNHGEDVPSIEEHQELMHTLEEREKALEDMESELKVSKGELAKKAVEMRTLERDLEQARLDVSQQQSSAGSSAGGADPAALAEAKKRVEYLGRKLADTDKNLRSKRETERSLNRSLKEALNLLRPLQMHLEEAEREKRELSMELRNLKKTLGGASPDSNDPAKGDSVDMAHVKELEYAVRQLEKENSQLHDALEDLSHSVNASRASAKNEKAQQQQAEQLRKEMHELKSHHDLTKSRLEDAFVENHSLVEALKKREMEESQMAQEVNVLRQQLERAEAQLMQQPQHQGTPQKQQQQRQQTQSLGRFKQQQQQSTLR